MHATKYCRNHILACQYLGIYFHIGIQPICIGILDRLAWHINSNKSSQNTAITVQIGGGVQFMCNF